MIDEFDVLKSEEIDDLLRRIETSNNPILDSHDLLMITQALEYFKETLIG